MIPLPYKLIAGALILLAVVAAAEFDGYKRSDAKWTAKVLAEERAYTEMYQKEVNRGNELSAKLSAAESNIQIKTIERVKYVDKVTDGRECLSSSAVALINNTPVIESETKLFASDTDITSWAIIANEMYDICSIRLNTLIDYENNL